MYKVLETQPQPAAPDRRAVAGERSRSSSIARWRRTARPAFKPAPRCSMRSSAAHGRARHQIERSRLQTVQLPAPAKSAKPVTSEPQSSRSKPTIWIGGEPGCSRSSQDSRSGASESPAPATGSAQSRAPSPFLLRPTPVENAATAAPAPSPSAAPLPPPPAAAPPRSNQVDSAAKAPARKPGSPEITTPAKPATAAAPTSSSSAGGQTRTHPRAAAGDGSSTAGRTGTRADSRAGTGPSRYLRAGAGDASPPPAAPPVRTEESPEIVIGGPRSCVPRRPRGTRYRRPQASMARARRTPGGGGFQ